jgi:hypothetical protein
MKKIKLTVFLLLSVFSAAFAQFEDGFANPTGDAIYNDPMRRLGSTGIGLYPGTTLPNSLLQVRANGPNSQISHVEQGTFGAFASGSQWLGLGTAGVGTAYGLAITKNTNTGVFNLLDEGTQTNLIAGFGGTASTNTNRFKIRGFSGTSLTSKDLFIVNPNGAIGVNVEPLATVWVDSKETTSSSLFRDIAIIGRQTAGSGSITTASALGNQQNTSLVFNNIAVEGFRAQFPDFADAATQIPLTGGAVNLQVVNNPLGTTDAIASSNSITGPSRPSRPMAGWASVPFSLLPALVDPVTNKKSCWM